MVKCDLVILRGPSGSGKTTWAKTLFPYAVLCSADDYFMHDGEYLFDPAKLPEAHQTCMASVLKAMAEGKSTIVVDGTHTRMWEWQNYLQVGLLAGYAVQVIEFNVATIDALRLCIDRNLHKVPGAAIANQVLRFEPHIGATVIQI